MPIMVDSRISLTCRGESRRSPTTGRQQSQPRYGEWMGSHRGLRAGHVFIGVTRERRRANASPCGTSGLGVPSREVKTPGAERPLAPLTRATWENKRDTKPAERHTGSGKDREHRTTPRRAIGSLSVSEYRRSGALRSGAGRWGTDVPGTHWRERSETNCCTCRWKSCRRNSPFGAVVISGSLRGDSEAGSPDVEALGRLSQSLV